MTTVPLQPVAFNDHAKPHHWHHDGWCFRGVTTTLALAVSGLYAAHPFFAQTGYPNGVFIMIAAGIAWPILFLGVWNSSEPRWKYTRLDWCFWTMTVGSVAMTTGLFVAQLFPTNQESVLLATLGVADVAMGWVFTRYAPTVGVTRPRALWIWGVCMNGLFIFFIICPVLIVCAFVATVTLLAIALGQATEQKVKA